MDGVDAARGGDAPQSQAPGAGAPGSDSPGGVIFDLDGVLTDTAELHFQSWRDLSHALDIPFDRAANEALRGLSRAESLRLFLGAHAARFSPDEQAALMDRKNRRYVERVAAMTPADALPGARELLAALRARGVPLALASSSRNARLVLERLALTSAFSAIVDGGDVARGKPDPEIFLLAARRLGLPPARCVVIEDAESGVQAARGAGMYVIGIGPAGRVGAADRVVGAIGDVQVGELLALVGSGKS